MQSSHEQHSVITDDNIWMFLYMQIFTSFHDQNTSLVALKILSLHYVKHEKLLIHVCC